MELEARRDDGVLPDGSPFKYLNADHAVASMKKNGAVLSVSGHQHEGSSLYEHEGLSFVCAPALWEPPYLFLPLRIEAAGKTTSETVSVDGLFPL